MLRACVLNKRHLTTAELKPKSHPILKTCLFLVISVPSAYTLTALYATKDPDFKEKYWNVYAPTSTGFVERPKETYDQIKKDFDGLVEGGKKGVDSAIELYGRSVETSKNFYEKVEKSTKEAYSTGKGMFDSTASKVENVYNSIKPKIEEKIEPKPSDIAVLDVTVLEKEEAPSPTVSTSSPVVIDTNDNKKSDKKLKVIPDDILANHKRNLNESLSIFKSLESPIISKKLVDCIVSLNKSLDEILSATTPSNQPLIQKILETGETLVLLSKHVAGLEVEQVLLLSKALEEQSSRFAEVIETQIQDHQRELSSQWNEMEKKTSAKIQEATDSLTNQLHQETMDMISEQSALYEQELQRQLSRRTEELNEYWERTVKSRVDEEREGRLARLDHLALKLKYLEKIYLETGDSLNRSIKNTNLRTAINLLSSQISSTTPQPIQQKTLSQIRKLVHDSTFLETIINSISTEKRILNINELRDGFNASKHAIRVAQFMPTHGGGPISYLLACGMSKLMFSKEGTTGEDVESVLARVEKLLGRGDVDGAARHLNQLQSVGQIRDVVGDWMGDARRYLEVKQAVDIVSTHLDFLDMNKL